MLFCIFRLNNRRANRVVDPVQIGDSPRQDARDEPRTLIVRVSNDEVEIISFVAIWNVLEPRGRRGIRFLVMRKMRPFTVRFSNARPSANGRKLCTRPSMHQKVEPRNTLPHLRNDISNAKNKTGLAIQPIS
jgi:hypothetical protein